MRAADAYRDLRALGKTIVTSREASTLWRVGGRTASRRLRALEGAELVRQIRKGLWSLDTDADPFVVAPYLTAPYPAYVSFASALRHHGMIEQMPRRTTVASLRRAEVIETSVGPFEIRRLAPEVFGGFSGSVEEGYIAAPEKAIFDSVYVRAAAGSQAHFPELTLPDTFDEGVLALWTERIPGDRLRTLVSRHLHESLEKASAATEPSS